MLCMRNSQVSPKKTVPRYIMHYKNSSVPLQASSSIDLHEIADVFHASQKYITQLALDAESTKHLTELHGKCHRKGLNSGQLLIMNMTRWLEVHFLPK